MRYLVALAAAGLLTACAASHPVPMSEHTAGKAARTAYRVVKGGDTLYSIAWDVGVDFRKVAQWNDIRPPYVIRPGQRLRIVPPPRAKRPPATSARRQASRSPATPRRTLPGAPASGPLGWAWPTEGRLVTRLSPRRGRKGEDIAGQYGQTVRSAAAGKVVYAGTGLRGYGRLIIVKHNETFLSAYAHNRKLLVSEGRRVTRGEPIAEMGSTGSNRVKLHFEIRRRGVPVDPMRYLPKR